MGQGSTDHWETVVNNDDLWSYRLGTSASPTDWMMPDFDDSSWLVGQGGIGYGDGDDNTIIEPTLSLFLRIDFDLIDTAAIALAVLHADYDDAFVAYLNGTEIGRGNIGDPETILGHDESPPIDQEAVLYTGGIPEAYPIYPSTFNELVQEGENTLAIQVNNFLITSSDLSGNFFLSLGITDTSSNYGPTPEWFIEPFLSSDLPLIRIFTSGQEIQNDPRIQAQMQIIDNGPDEVNYITDPATDYDGQISIEIRGESSLAYEKKNYAFETQDQDGENNNVPLLGMPPENDWILYGPYSDKSLIRNALTFEIGRDVMEYASRTAFCELMINEEYRGVYILMEKIKQDDFRVDIAKLLPEDIEGDELTGGYIIEKDRDNPDLNDDGWYSSFAPYPFYTYHDPDYDQLMPAQKNYIQDWFFAFESAMNLTTYAGSYDQFIDVESFVDYFLVTELTKHIDAYKLSFYMYKEKDSNGGKLHMGPLWDFNLGYGNFDFGCEPSPEGWIYSCTSQVFWVSKILDVEAVNDRLFCRWQQLRQNELDTDFLINRIDSLVELIGPAADRNFDRFPVIGEYVWPNSFIGESYQDEVDFLKTWLEQRIFWMDMNMPGDPNADCGEILSQEHEEAKKYLEVYPNPFTEKLTFSFSKNGFNKGEVLLYDLMGNKVAHFRLIDQSTVFLDHLPAGIYFFHYKVSDLTLQCGKLIKQ